MNHAKLEGNFFYCKNDLSDSPIIVMNPMFNIFKPIYSLRNLLILLSVLFVISVQTCMRILSYSESVNMKHILMSTVPSIRSCNMSRAKDLKHMINLYSLGRRLLMLREVNGEISF
jgi:hypothetical protein